MTQLTHAGIFMDDQIHRFNKNPFAMQNGRFGFHTA